MGFRNIILKIIKFSGLFCGFSLGIILVTAIIIYWLNPSYFIYFYTNSQDEKLYVDIEFGPFEKSFPIYKVGPNSSYVDLYWNANQFIKWSPDKKLLAFISDVPGPDYAHDQPWAVNILNPRTFKKIKTVIVSDFGGSYFWLNNETIRYFRGMGTGAGIYKDININSKKPMRVAEELSDENAEDWHFVTLGDMSNMEDELAKINPRY